MDDPGQSERRCATVIFDFGREITGYTQFDVAGNAGAIVDVVHGELITAGRVQSMRQGTHYADRYILREGRQQHEIYDWKGFRYVQLTFRNLTRPLAMHALRVIFSSYPVDKSGKFRCEDRLLEQIWTVGAYTQQLCMHDRLMDCPWREQVQWLGDGRIQLLILQNAFGANDICRKFIEDFAHSQLESGLIPSISGAGDQSPVQDIIDYALWWIVAVEDVIAFDGNTSLASEMFPCIERLLTFFQEYINDDGLIENIPGWVFIDWASIRREGCVAPLNGIYYMALRSAEKLAVWARCEASAHLCRKAMQLIEKNFHRVFWSKEYRLYRDCIENNASGEGSFSQHTQAVAILSGLSCVESRELMEQTLSNESLVQASPFFSYYLLEALAQAGLGEEAVALIRTRWGAMLDAGATTFWEEWQENGSYRDGVWVARPRSLCHAWSAAPTAWLSRFVLGIRPESKTEHVLFAPNICGLAKVSGSVPTRYGAVNVSWRVIGGEFEAELTLPVDGVNVQFCPPYGYEDRSSLVVNGELTTGSIGRVSVYSGNKLAGIR
jgi:hypothetical protein